MSIEKSLARREQVKKRKPNFFREDWHKRKAAPKTSWRKPRGKHSKMRHGFQGHPASADPGYGSPGDVHGLHSSGLMPIRVHNSQDLSVLNKSVHAVIIGATVGTRKKADIVKKASSLGLRIIGVKNPAEYLKTFDEMLASKKARKTDKTKKEKTKEVKAEAKKEEKKEEVVSSEDAKKKETKEFEKVLTQRAR